MDAAFFVYASRGIDGTSVNEITTHANVANGTFYYYYKDNTEFVDALEHAVATMFVDRVDKLIEDLTDGAERVATATQQTIHSAAANAAWGVMIVHAFMNLEKFSGSISPENPQRVRSGLNKEKFESIRPTPHSASCSW